MYTNRIDLDYISASKVKEFINYDIYDTLMNTLSEEVGRIEGYISKYDNKWDRLEGTSVDDLIEARTILYAKLDKVRELDRAFKLENRAYIT